jgi:hypothetical protein
VINRCSAARCPYLIKHAQYCPEHDRQKETTVVTNDNSTEIENTPEQDAERLGISLGGPPVYLSPQHVRETEDRSDYSDGDSGLTDEQIRSGLDARLGLDSAPLRLPTIDGPSADRPYVAATVNLPAAPPWDVDPQARPAAYVSARERLVQAAQRANELAERLAALPGEKARAVAAFEAEAVAADRESRTPRFAKARDYAKEQAVLEAQHRGRRAESDAARSDYNAVVGESQQEWLAALLDRREAARQAAVEAWASQPAPEALAAVRHWRAIVTGTTTLWKKANPKKSVPPAPQLGLIEQLATVAQQTLALLQSEDEAVTGAWMTSTIEPPLHERKRMAESGGGARMALLDIELAERFEVSAWTKPDALAFGMWGEVKTTPSGMRYLAS